MSDRDPDTKKQKPETSRHEATERMSQPANESAARRLFETLKRVLIRIGEFQARVMLTVFYFVIFGPFSLLVRRTDPLTISGHKAQGWLHVAPRSGAEIERAHSQS